MRRKPGTTKSTAWAIVTDLGRRTQTRRSAEETIRIVPEGLRGEESVRRALPAAGDRHEPVRQLVERGPGSTHCVDGKKRRAGDTARQATSPEVKALRQEAAAPKGEAE